jgi:hypothetical protein
MCCFSTIILLLIPRLAIVYWWLAYPQSHNLPFKSWVLPGLPALPAWIWTVLGAIFLPWTTLAYLFLYPGGILGNEWIVMVIALLIDLVSHGGSFYNRRRFPYRRH